MNYFKSLLPNSIPDAIDSTDELKVWQERFLQYLLFIGFLVGTTISGIAYSYSLDSANWALFTGSLILAIGSAMLLLSRRSSYWFRSIAELFVFFIFANTTYAHNGWSGVALILLLGFSLLSTILLYRTPTRIGVGISLVTLLFWAVLYQTGLTPQGIGNISLGNTIINVLLVIATGMIGNQAILSLKSLFLSKRSDLLISKGIQTELKDQVQEQKKSLEKRLDQLRTASEISQKVSSILDPDVLIQQVADLVNERFGLYYVGVFLIDNSREYAVLKYGTGEAGKRMLASKHRLAVGGFSMIGWATQTRKPRIALDIGDEAVHFDNPFLPNTRSELALPIISNVNVLGAFTIQSDKENAFDENDILILQSIADSIGIALENASSYKKTQSALEEIQMLNRQYVQESWWNSIDQADEIKYEFENQQAPELKGKKSTIQVPIKIRNEVIGQFTIESDQKSIPEDQINFIESISNQTSIALENARLLRETQRAALQEQRINAISSQFSKALTIEEILKSAVTEFGRLPAVSEASISLLPPGESSSKRLPDREVK